MRLPKGQLVRVCGERPYGFTSSGDGYLSITDVEQGTFGIFLKETKLKVDDSELDVSLVAVGSRLVVLIDEYVEPVSSQSH